MKKLFLSLTLVGLLMVGMSKQVKADTYFTTQSTGVLVASFTAAGAASFVVQRVIVSSGSGYVLLIDSASAGTGTEGSNIGGAYSVLSFPVSQWMTPQIELSISSQPAAGSTTIIPFVGYKSIEVGYAPKNGLIILQSATPPATVTIVKTAIKKNLSKNINLEDSDSYVYETYENGKIVQTSKLPPSWLRQKGE